MPPQQSPRSHQARAARGALQVAGRRRKQGTIRGTKARPRHLTAQDLELVTQDEQLDVLEVQTAATPHERAQQRPERDVENEKATVGDPRNPPAKVATRLAPAPLGEATFPPFSRSAT